MILAKCRYITNFQEGLFENCIKLARFVICCKYEQLRLRTKDHGETAVMQLSALSDHPRYRSRVKGMKDEA